MRRGLFWTADPAAPEMDRARRFHRGVAALRANGVGLCDDPGKVYLHGGLVPEGFGELARQMTGADLPMMTSVSSTGLREVYWHRQSRRAGDLWRMRRDPVLAPLDKALDASLADWTGQGLDGGGGIGLSLTADAKGRVIALAAFVFLRQAGGEAVVRNRLLREGGEANPALAELWAEGRLRPMLLTLGVTAAGAQAALGLRLALPG